MKNLTVIQRASRILKDVGIDISNLNDSDILHAVNSTNDDFYLLLRHTLYKIPSNYNDDVSSSRIDEAAEFISLEYCSLSNELYAASKSGSMFTIDVESKFLCEKAIELNAPIQCMKLSPDHEIITLVTVYDVMITMVSTFQTVAEVDLHCSYFGQQQFETVGWGKKETQFHGSEGKKAAIVKPVEQSENYSDDGLCRITWREDGLLFAVSFLNDENQRRQFKVFSREGILQYTSELISNLEEPISWKPSGSLIATTQSLSNKYVVALFEKNGLKHREFVLPYEADKTKVKDLFWSPDSEILTIWLVMKENSTSVLQLWSENNYHWYLKQSIEFPVDNPLIRATWCIAFFSKRLILLTAKELIICDYNWTVHHSRGRTVDDKSIVTVINGNKLLVTGFRLGIMPPPMAHQTLETSECINAIVFAPAVNSKNSWVDSNAFCCVTATNKLIFYKHVIGSSLEYERVGSYDVKWDVTTDYDRCLYNMNHFLWFDEDHMLCSLSMDNQSLLCVISLKTIDSCRDQKYVLAEQIYGMGGLVQHVIPSPKPGEAYVIAQHAVIKYEEADKLVPTGIELQGYIYEAKAVQIGKKHVLLALHHRNCFSINGKEIANNITSFFVHSEFLLLTTTQHTLIYVRLNEAAFDELAKQDLSIKPWENEKLNENSFANLNVRRLERGSQLIVSIPNDSRTILQMPRGNLECIQPRALSLYIIGLHLRNLDYLAAFDLMRRQRINLNLLYDHDPQTFVNNVQIFFRQISKPSWLSLLLLELSDEDVTTTIYASYYRRERTKSTINKVDLVCNLLRKIMEEKNTNNCFIQPILISLVKNKKRHGIEDALTKIDEIRRIEIFTKNGKNGNNGNNGNNEKNEKNEKNEECITSDEALKYLLYIVDVNELFDIALGMYDFELTMYVASKSQKDPKEYIPFLNNLRKLDNNYMKYSIDLYLKRYESALQHIARQENRFDECINLVRNHDLYIKALKLFEKDSEQYKEIARMYGTFLLKKRQFHEAGIMFHRSGDFDEARDAYISAGSWQDVIILSAEMNLSELDKHTVYKDIAERLKTSKQYVDAAHVLSIYLKDPKEAIIALCNGKRWRDAITMAYNTQNSDLIESHVKPSVCECATDSKYRIEKNQEDFENYRLRLAIVRKNIGHKNLKHDKTISDSESGHKDVSDILSDTSSISNGSVSSQRSKLSTSSGTSYSSSKNRRKQERKLSSLKEGSTFEDVALIQALYHIINNTYKDRDDLRILMQMLLYFGYDNYAEALQNSMEQFLRSIEKSKFEIWNKSAPSSLAEMEMQGMAESQKLVEPYILCPPVDKSLPWKSNIF